MTLDKAAIWMDGRYHLQAESQVDCNWIIQKQGVCCHSLYVMKTKKISVDIILDRSINTVDPRYSEPPV